MAGGIAERPIISSGLAQPATSFPGRGLWLTLAAIAIIDATWLTLSQRLSLDPWSSLPILPVVTLLPLLASYCRTRDDFHLQRLSDPLAGTLFIALAFAALRVFNHLTMSQPFPWVDDTLAKLDADLGFNWLGYTEWISRQPLIIDAFPTDIYPAHAGGGRRIRPLVRCRGRRPRQRIHSAGFLERPYHDHYRRDGSGERRDGPLRVGKTAGGVRTQRRDLPPALPGRAPRQRTPCPRSRALARAGQHAVLPHRQRPADRILLPQHPLPQRVVDSVRRRHDRIDADHGRALFRRSDRRRVAGDRGRPDRQANQLFQAGVAGRPAGRPRRANDRAARSK